MCALHPIDVHYTIQTSAQKNRHSHDGMMNCGSVFPAYPSLVYLKTKSTH